VKWLIDRCGAGMKRPVGRCEAGGRRPIDVSTAAQGRKCPNRLVGTVVWCRL
jgi:hypothetical protein